MKTSKRVGFSLIELIVVLGILAVISALLFPALAKARSSSSRTSEISRLRSIWQATMLYTADYDSSGIIVDSLPPPDTFVEMCRSKGGFYGVNLDFTKSRCRKHPQNEVATDVLVLPDKDSKDYYMRLYLRYGDIMPAFMNFNCNDADVNLRSIYTTKTGYAALLSGTAVKKQAKGPANDILFWVQ